MKLLLRVFFLTMAVIFVTSTYAVNNFTGTITPISEDIKNR